MAWKVQERLFLMPVYTTRWHCGAPPAELPCTPTWPVEVSTLTHRYLTMPLLSVPRA